MTGAALWTVVTHQWPRKLAALAIATLVWMFVSTSDTTVAQRSLLVPITVEGIAPDLVPIGVPEVAEVTVSGTSQRLDRLRPESIEAVLDLSGLSGDFAAPVAVAPPQGVVLERVAPAEVLGILERVATREVPVTVIYLGEVPADVRVLASSDPSTVRVRGRGARLERVTQVLVAVEPSAEATSAAPFPADASGRPVDEVTVEPATVDVVVERLPVLAEGEVPLRLLPVVIGGVTDVVASHQRVRVVAPPSRLASLDELVAAAVLPTERPAAGRYTLAVNVAVPSGVRLLDEVTVDVTYVDTPTVP